jgi:hypothetical protein
MSNMGYLGLAVSQPGYSMGLVHVCRLSICLFLTRTSFAWSIVADHGSLETGRHPLTELVIPQFVPNDTAMLEVEDRVQVRNPLLVHRYTVLQL